MCEGGGGSLRRGIVTGRIVAQVTVSNHDAPETAMQMSALVDTGATYLTLPMAWKPRFGTFDAEEEVALPTATQERVVGLLCGPAKIALAGFQSCHGEVLFTRSQNGGQQPVLGRIPLLQCRAKVDVHSNRLLPIKYLDLK